MEHKKILVGTNAFNSAWLICINKINKPNLIKRNFKFDLEKIIQQNNIDYIIPLSKQDFLLAKKTKYIDKILYPTEINIELLTNKLKFTKFMLEEFPNYIPKVFYLENKKLNEDIKFPLISKPIYSTNGKDMFIIKNQDELKKLTNKKIIQEFIDLEYEYGAFFLCINGKIINIKIIKKFYPKYHIKKRNFTDFIEVNNFPIEIFEEITLKINYSGGGNIDFKYDEDKKKIYIFEFNARFGGSAFSKNFIYDLLCIK